MGYRPSVSEGTLLADTVFQKTRFDIAFGKDQFNAGLRSAATMSIGLPPLRQAQGRDVRNGPTHCRLQPLVLW